MSTKLTVIIVCGDKKRDEMMHNFDVFEPFKRLIDTDQFGRPVCSAFEAEVTAAPNYPQVLSKFRAAIERDGSKRVLACFCPGIKEGAWRDATCTHFSTGKSWGSLDTLLTGWGFVS